MAGDEYLGDGRRRAALPREFRVVSSFFFSLGVSWRWSADRVAVELEITVLALAIQRYSGFPLSLSSSSRLDPGITVPSFREPSSCSDRGCAATAVADGFGETVSDVACHGITASTTAWTRVSTHDKS